MSFSTPRLRGSSSTSAAEPDFPSANLHCGSELRHRQFADWKMRTTKDTLSRCLNASPKHSARK